MWYIKRERPDLSHNIQPFDSLPDGIKRWMFNPPLDKKVTPIGSLYVRGYVPHIFWLAVHRPKGDSISVTYASVAYSRGWWCVGKTTTDVKYNIYFTPTGGIVFQGSLGECCRRMLLLPEYPEGMPLDPPTTIDEWYASGEVARASQRWEEISSVLFQVKESNHEVQV